MTGRWTEEYYVAKLVTPSNVTSLLWGVFQQYSSECVSAWETDEAARAEAKRLWQMDQEPESSNPNAIDEALKELARTLTHKRHDYANDSDPFSNFSDAARVAGITTKESIMSQIGIKLARLKNLESQEGEPKNEPIADSALDLAGYAVILYAYYRSRL